MPLTGPKGARGGCVGAGHRARGGVGMRGCVAGTEPSQVGSHVNTYLYEFPLSVKSLTCIPPVVATTACQK